MALVDVIIPVEGSDREEVWKEAASKKLGVEVSEILATRVRKHSIDARQNPIKIQLRLEIWTRDEMDGEDACAIHQVKDPGFEVRQVSEGAKRVVIVGCGPAGMFAGLKCLELGMKPVILERGKDASARRFDLAPILREGRVIEDSNYCFGEGGAGTFSDGKLYTRAKKRGPVSEIYRILVAHGAPEQILIDAHPHIGSNLLPNVVKAIRQTLINAGGEVHFQTKVADLLVEDGCCNGVVDTEGNSFMADAVILATGHSARDIYSLLARKNIKLEPKPFAVGMRIEHSQKLIDRIQYHLGHDEDRHRLLPAARYRLATKIKDRGVHSFCMCPGGFIVPASTENDEVVVNGMSLSRRDSKFANSGFVVTIEPQDVQHLESEHGILAGLAFQKNLERAAKSAGGGGQVAPGQRVIDFVEGRASTTLGKTSYFPGIVPARLDKILPDWITWRMRKGLHLFGRQMDGYLGEEAHFLGFETRTSSPLRIPRELDTLSHPEVSGLIPCGEGAGFAGGIVSAAMDGMRCAQAAHTLNTRD